jgi:cytochrome c oxidase assembly factor CtaG
MGVREITTARRVLIPLVVFINIIFIASLVFLNTGVGSEFLPQTSWIVSYALALLKFLSYFFGLAVLALILKNGILESFIADSAPGVRALALTWSLTAFATAFFVLANALSIPFSQAANLGVLFTYGWDLSTARAYLLMALVALLIWLAHRSPKRSTIVASSLFALLALTLPAALSHAGGVSTHQWAVLSGAVHGFSISLWIGSLLGLIISSDKKFAYLNFQKLVNPAFWLLLFSGIISSAIRLNNPAELLTTTYGQLLTLKISLFLIVITLVLLARKRVESSQPILFLEITLLSLILSIATVLSSTDYPKVFPSAFTLIESVTGFAEPPPFNVAYALTTLAIEPTILFVGTFAIYFYLKGVFTLRARGDKWPIMRTVYWVSGVSLTMYFTNTMMGRYALVMFSAHMVLHMTLAMVVPILLPLAAPFTLALRALPASAKTTISLRESLEIFLSSRFSVFLTNPIVAFLLFATSTWMLYFTPLLTTLMSSHLGHLFMDLHFILVGYVFFWTIIGKDLNPHKISDPARLGLVFLAAVFHGFFGFIVSSATTPLGGGWFFQVSPTWLSDPLMDQQLGGSIAWGFGEIPTVVVLIILLIQWARRDERAAKRFTQADTDSYNEYLAKLNERG